MLHFSIKATDKIRYTREYEPIYLISIVVYCIYEKILL